MNTASKKVGTERFGNPFSQHPVSKEVPAIDIIQRNRVYFICDIGGLTYHQFTPLLRTGDENHGEEVPGKESTDLEARIRETQEGPSRQPFLQ